LSVLSFLKAKKSAPVARERLQILLAHERAMRGQPDLLNVLREEILAVVAKHVAVEEERVQVKMNKGPAVSTLEIDIEIPNVARARIAVNM
jgi:cell division topological specificity factor